MGTLSNALTSSAAGTTVWATAKPNSLPRHTRFMMLQKIASITDHDHHRRLKIEFEITDSKRQSNSIAHAYGQVGANVFGAVYSSSVAPETQACTHTFAIDQWASWTINDLNAGSSSSFGAAGLANV